MNVGKGFISNLINKEPDALPDIYIIDDCDNYRPKPDFVMSRDADGNVISVFSDDIWDFGPYTNSLIENHYLYFDSVVKEEREPFKWICFLFIYYINNGISGKVTVATIYTKFIHLRMILNFGIENNTDLKGVLESECLLKEFVKLHTNKKVKKPIIELATIMTSLLNIDFKISGIKPVQSRIYTDIFNLAKKLNHVKQQHAVIPPRIYVNYLCELNKLIDYYLMWEDKLTPFLKKISISPNYGRSISMQSKNGLRTNSYEPVFNDVINKYNVEEYISYYDIKSISNLGSHLTKIQDACKLLLIAYSGMRKSEAYSLKFNCLKKEELKNGLVVRLIGETSKLIGTQTSVQWVTSIETEKTVRVAQSLAKLSNIKLNFKLDDLPLLVTTSFINIASTRRNYESMSLVSRISCDSMRAYNLINKNKIKIEKDDIAFLYDIDPLGDWRALKDFKEGELWNITNHQLRRSLAFYVSCSGMVSLQSLRRQLKHISCETTLYYANGSGLDHLFTSKLHFKDDLKKTVSESKSYAFNKNLLFSDEKIYGSQGVYIERSKTEIQDDQIIEQRNQIEIEIKEGRMAYKETHMGGCMSGNLCEKRMLRSLTSCINCNHAALQPSKVDYVIKKQELLVSKLEDSSPDSIELRIERNDLKSLKTLRNKMEK